MSDTKLENPTKQKNNNYIMNDTARHDCNVLQKVLIINASDRPCVQHPSNQWRIQELSLGGAHGERRSTSL